MTHNANLPRHFYALVRAPYLYDQQSGQGEFVPCVVHGVSSVPSRSLAFHVLLENGARFSDLPLHALCLKADAPERELTDLSLWDCFGWDVTAIEYDYLREIEVKAALRTGETALGQYACSFDWRDGGFSNEPSQHKEMHLIALDEGNFALLPNNRLCWMEPSFVTPFEKPPAYKVQTRRWYSEEGFHLTDNRMFYEPKADE